MTHTGAGVGDQSASARRLSRLTVRSEEERGHDDPVDILGLFRLVWHRKRLVALSCLVSTVSFFVIAMLQEREYSAIATVMLDPREQQFVATQDQVVSDLKLNSPILESEVAILRSRSLWVDAIERVGLDHFNIIDPAFAEPSIFRRALRYVWSPGDRNAEKSALTLKQQRLNRIVHALRQSMDIRRVGDSYVIKITASTIDAVLSAKIANALASGYIERQLQDRKRVAESATQWLAEQVEQRRQDVVRKETEVAAFRRGQLDLSLSTDETLEQQLEALNQQLVQAQAEQTSQQARLEQIEKLLVEKGGLAAAETQQSSYLLAMRTEQSERVQEASRLKETRGPQHPELRTLLNEINQIEETIVQEVQNIAQAYRNEVSVLFIQEASLQEKVDQTQAKLSDNAAASLDLRQLEREAEAARETYEELLARLGETRAQAEIQRAEARLVNAAQIPGGPSSPRVKLLTAFGATLGLSVGLMAALCLELMSSGFLAGSQVERATKLPVLTTIPKVVLNSPAAVLKKMDDCSFSLFSERVRLLRTMLEMGSPSTGSRSIVLLSSVPDEGKTTTALALAKSYAASGKKTLLLDLDTRRSALLTELVGPDFVGLGDHLKGTATLDDVIFEDRAQGFSIAGCEQHTAVLADSVSTLVLKDLITKLQTRFEMIVIDAPPVLAVADGLEIASVSDSILYVVRHRKTSKKSVSYGLSALRHVGLRPAGIVLSMTDVNADPDSYADGYTYT